VARRGRGLFRQQADLDLRNVTAINRDGEETLLKLMTQGARFRCVDVFTKDVLKRVARKIRCND